jgi:hypothetical protein
MTLQTSNPPPPPQALQVESAASNVAPFINQSHGLGESSPTLTTFSSSPAILAFNLSVSPLSHTAPPRLTASSSLRPQITQKQTFHQPQTPPTRTLSMPKNPQFGMPTCLWPQTHSNTSLSFQSQTPNISNPHTSTFFQAPNTYTQTIQAHTQHPQPHYYHHNQPYPPYYTQQWPHQNLGWPEPPPPYPNQTHYNPNNQNHDHSFAQSFNKGLKLEFPRFDGENPIGWLRQAEKCFALAETPIEKKSKIW